MIEGTKPEASEPEESGTTPDADPCPDPEGSARANGRQALRAARRRRRRISIGCAVFVAGCTAVTLLIVGIASSRSSSPPPVAPTATAAAHLPGADVDLQASPKDQIPSQSYETYAPRRQEEVTVDNTQRHTGRRTGRAVGSR
jgi:hypothetical protein